MNWGFQWGYQYGLQCKYSSMNSSYIFIVYYYILYICASWMLSFFELTNKASIDLKSAARHDMSRCSYMNLVWSQCVHSYTQFACILLALCVSECVCLSYPRWRTVISWMNIIKYNDIDIKIAILTYPRIATIIIFANCCSIRQRCSQTLVHGINGKSIVLKIMNEHYTQTFFFLVYVTYQKPALYEGTHRCNFIQS